MANLIIFNLIKMAKIITELQNFTTKKNIELDMGDFNKLSNVFYGGCDV